MRRRTSTRRSADEHQSGTKLGQPIHLLLTGKRLFAPPARSRRRVLQQNPARQEIVADAIAFLEVARLARGVAGGDELLDLGVEVLFWRREDVERRIDLHQR